MKVFMRRVRLTLSTNFKLLRKRQVKQITGYLCYSILIIFQKLFTSQ